MGQPSRALPVLLQALRVRRKALGDNHPDVAASLHCIAVVHTVRTRGSTVALMRACGHAYGCAQDLGWLPEALAGFTDALRILRNALGDDNIALVVTLTDMVRVHHVSRLFCARSCNCSIANAHLYVSRVACAAGDGQA